MNFLKKEYIVVDNILSIKDINLIENTLLDPYFAWYITSNKINGKFSTCSKDAYLLNKDKNTVEDLQFSHSFVHYENGQTIIKSKYYELIESITKKIVNHFGLNQISLLRVKTNLKVKNVYKNKHGTPHIDIEGDNIIGIYYVNDSDGYTYIFKDKKTKIKIAPKKGRFLFFKGNMLHAAGYPSKSQLRCIINFNFKL